MNQISNLEKHIVIADDNSVIRKLLKSILIKKIPNGVFFEAVDGDEVIDFLEYNHIDWLFLDWHMPKLDGDNIVKTLKENNTYKDLKIIMVTAETDREKINTILKHGRISYLVNKPVKSEKIEQIIENLLK